MEFNLEGDFHMDADGWGELHKLVERAEREGALEINLPGLPFMPGRVILNGVEYIRKEEEEDESSVSGSAGSDG